MFPFTAIKTMSGFYVATNGKGVVYDNGDNVLRFPDANEANKFLVSKQSEILIAESDFYGMALLIRSQTSGGDAANLVENFYGRLSADDFATLIYHIGKSS